MTKRTSEELKKEREWNHLADFKSRYTGFPSGEVTTPEPPAPDFLVGSGDKSIGIEMQYYEKAQSEHGSAFREDGRLYWDYLPDRAQKAFGALGHKVPLLVYFDRNEPFRLLTRSDIERLAPITAKIVAQNIPRENGNRVQVSLEQLKGTPLAEFGISLDIAPGPMGQASWCCKGSGQATNVLVNELQWCIASKEDKVDNYLQHGGRKSVWLLIVAEGHLPSSFARLPDAMKQHSFPTRFERVIFFNRHDGSIFILNK